MDAVRDLIEEIDADLTTDYWRVQVRTQRQLWEDGIALRSEDGDSADAAPKYTGGKWGQYVRGPDSWFELTERARDRMIPLQELTEVARLNQGAL